MDIKIKPLLLKCDFIGFIPQFRILEETRYKSIFSSILSIIIIIFSAGFVFYSFVDYLNQNPSVHYYKNNDLRTNKTYTISNSLLMFQNHFFCLSNNSEEYNITISAYDNKNYFYENIDYEPCKLGKNLDIKYKDIIEEFERIEHVEISDFYCLNYNGTEFTLENKLYLPEQYQNSLEIRLKTTCENYLLGFNLITQNDFIEHKNKKNPIVPYYQKHSISSNATILDLGSRDAKWVSFKDGKFHDMDWNTSCASSTGATVEMLMKFYDVDLSDLKFNHEKFAVTCGIFGMEKIMDDISSGAEPSEAISKFIHGIAFNAWNFAKKPEKIYLSGGFCENIAFVESLKQYCEVISLGRFVLCEGLF